MDINDIDAQIAELQRQKEELLRVQKEEADKIALELSEKKLKEEANAPVVFTITKYTISQLYIVSDVHRIDYSNLMLSYQVPSYIRQDFNKGIINIRDYPKWKGIVDSLPNTSIINKCEEHIEYYLHGPHAEVMMDDKVAKVKLHPDISHYNIFKDMAGSNAARLMPDHLYHVPKNELYRLMKIAYEYKAGEIKWDDESKEYALKDLENRKLLDDIAVKEYSPEFDIDLNGHKLKPFQTVGVEFGITTKKTIGKGNIRWLCADPTGLGKTWQSIATIKADTDEEPDKPFKVAVFCTATIKENWRREILALTGHSAKTMKGTQPSIEDMTDMVMGDYKWFIFNYDIVSRAISDMKDVTLPSGRVIKEEKERHLWIEALNTLGFTHVIFDEWHKCKNTESGRTKAILKIKIPNIIGLTATPVVNRPMELYPGLSLLDPDTFNNAASFEARYQNGNYGVRNVEELRNVLKPYMIRRKRSDVQKDLDPIVRKTMQVEMTDQQREVYLSLLNSVMADLNEMGESMHDLGEINHILTKILRMKQFLSKIKAQTVAEFAIELYNQADSDDPHKKVIIFSQFAPNVHKLVRFLGSEARYIIGEEHSSLDRQLIVDDFQSNKYVHFLVATPQSTSEGLNITAAGHIVWCDYPWTPAMIEQGEGRAYGRLKDSHSIVSHFFAVQNSLDDWLRDIILQKLQTIEAVVEGVAAARMTEGSIIKELFKALKRGELR